MSPVAPRRRAAARGIGFATILLFAVLGVAAVGVFTVLPRWVEDAEVAETGGAPVAESDAESATEPGSEPAPAAEIPSPDPSDPEALRDAAGQRLEARQALEGLARRVAALERRGASDWGGAAWREAGSTIEAGRARFEARDWSAALAAWDEAGRALDAVDARADETLRAALDAGRNALASGDAVAAAAAFDRALLVDPGNAEAKAGQRRARVWDDVATLLADASDAEVRGELRRAAETYRRALALDARAEEARRGLGRVEARLADDAFGGVMSEGFAALESGDYPAARAAFGRAKAMRPQAAEQVSDALAQVASTERRSRLETLRTAGRTAEEEERFRDAEARYEEALKLDPAVAFALEGRERARARAELAEAVDAFLDRPERLSSAEVLAEAERVLDRAEALSEGGADGGVDAGPKHRERTQQLADLLERWAVPVPVTLTSDGATEVTIYHVGTLGSFSRRGLELRPGSYTVVGHRPGFRDVRHTLRVEPGTSPESLDVRCVEPI